MSARRHSSRSALRRRPGRRSSCSVLRGPQRPITTRRSARRMNPGCRLSSSPRTDHLSCAGSALARRSTRSSSTANRCAGSASRHPRGRRRRAAALPLDCLPGAGRRARRDASRAPHLNLPWREPLAPLPVEGAVTATDPLALHGRDVRPLTAVTPIDMEPSPFLLDEIAGHIGDAIVGGDRCRSPARSRAARAACPLANASGFPILAEPTSQLRCGPHDRSHVVSSLRPAAARRALPRIGRPDLVLRFGEMPASKPLRSWLRPAAPTKSSSTRCCGWNEPTRRAAAMLRADPTELAAGWAAAWRGGRPEPARWLEAEQRHARP